MADNRIAVDLEGRHLVEAETQLNYTVQLKKEGSGPGLVAEARNFLMVGSSRLVDMPLDRREVVMARKAQDHNALRMDLGLVFHLRILYITLENHQDWPVVD